MRLHRTTIETIQGLRSEIESAAAKHGLAPSVLAGLVIVESSGNSYAIRVERRFWSRYLEGIRRHVFGTRTSRDDRWMLYPDLTSCSYGLCQVLLVVAWENGVYPEYPTELCEPRKNLDLGAKILAKHLKSRGTIEGALLRYNGGGNRDYPEKVLRTARALVLAGAIRG